MPIRIVSTSPAIPPKSIAFGAGPHYCAGAFASRAMVADVALPGIFARLKGLRLDEREPVRIGGWAFRGLLNLPVMWEAELSHGDRSPEPRPRPLPRLLGLDLAVARRRVGVQRRQQPPRGCGDFGDGAIERLGIGLRRRVESGQLAHELQRRGVDFRPASPAARN